MQELIRRQVEITNALGFHLRAAGRFVQLSQQFQVKVRVSCDGRAADGRSILDLITLAAGRGARLELEVIGPDAEEAAAALCASSRPGSTSSRIIAERDKAWEWINDETCTRPGIRPDKFGFFDPVSSSWSGTRINLLFARRSAVP